jgi:hypothetical protein
MAAGEGAHYCLGIDKDPAHTKRGLAALALTHITNVEILTADVFTYTPHASFDIVLCLNVVQHLGSIDRVEVLVDKCAEFATEELILICPLPDHASSTFEYVLRGKVPYVLISPEYFRRKYGEEAVRVVHLEDQLYGPNRALIRIRKLRA